MPVMDGLQATKEIRRLEKLELATSSGQDSPVSPGSRPPSSSRVVILAQTASSLHRDRVTALAAGCDDFVTKPVNLVWLTKKIIEWGSIKALLTWVDRNPNPILPTVERVPNGRTSSLPAASANITPSTPAPTDILQSASGSSDIMSSTSTVFTGQGSPSTSWSALFPPPEPPAPSLDTHFPATPNSVDGALFYRHLTKMLY